MQTVSFADSTKRVAGRCFGTAEHSVLERSCYGVLQDTSESEVCQRRVLVVHSDRGAADDLGLLVSESGGCVMIAYGYTRAIEVAEMFQPDLVLADLWLTATDGSSIAMRLRERQRGRRTKIVALSGHGSSRPCEAMSVGFDLVLTRPVSQSTVFEMLMSLPVTKAEEQDSAKTQSEHSRESNSLCDCESVFCEAVLKIQQDIFKTKKNDVRTKLVNDILIVRMQGRESDDDSVAGTSMPGQSRQTSQPRWLRRDVMSPILEMLVQSVFGVQVRFMDHDICESTGEEVIVIALSESPSANLGSKTVRSRRPLFHQERRNPTDGFGFDEETSTRLPESPATAQMKTLWDWESED